MPLKFSNLSFTLKRAIPLALLLFPASLTAEPPAPLTPGQLRELDQLATPMKGQIEQERAQAQKIIQQDTDRSDNTEVNMRDFLTSIGHGALLAQNTPATTPPVTPPPATPVDPQPATPAAGDPKTKPAAKPKETILKVECDNGLYFDSENGVLAYLKNVRLTEPRFNLTCSDELKVFLEQKPAKKPDPKAQKDKATAPAPTSPATDNKTKDEAKQQPKAKADEKKDKGLSSFGELKRIVATGNVKVVQKDDKGRLFIASGGVASYDAKTGEMILKGGMPRLQQSKNQYLQAMEPGQWIRIHKNGKLVTSNGKWVMQTTTKP
ncbi:MAG: hypothetical protein H7A51_01005 [Akkermansiaceae bacterium]|nr:hypothetical protein [Akkermansiaceae bacterium]